MQLYGLKNCDTCRKSVKALGDVEMIDVRSDGISKEILAAAYDRFGAALINTRSTTWRGLNAEERDKDPLELLLAHPALMKRPLIVDGADMYLGWNKEVQATLGAA